MVLLAPFNILASLGMALAISPAIGMLLGQALAFHAGP